ncbi:Cytochrome P450 [Metarhizium brunneum]
MEHSFLLGHLLVVRKFHLDWATDANFIQSFGSYMAEHWKDFFPAEDSCPPVVYVDVWPLSRPMAYSLKAYVSNQMEMGQLLAKSPMQGKFLEPISKGRDLNCMHGDEWRAWRSTFNPGFSKSNIRSWIPALLQDAQSFATVISKLCGEGGSWGPVFQLEKISADLAFDSAGRVIINSSLKSQTSCPSLFTLAYREQLQRMEITLSPLKLLWRATPMFKMQIARRRRELFNHLRPFICEAISGNSHGSPQTIVQAAVDACKQESQGSGKPQMRRDEDFVEQIFCQLMIFFFGGDDAISTVIPWMFKHLESNPDCVAKLRAEHDQVLGPDPRAAADKIRLSPHILDSLQYTMGVIKETLRINPATITIRQGQRGFDFNIKGSEMPWPTDGFDLFDSSITIHRDPENFPRPLEFIPDRFVVAEGHPLHPPKNVWRGFQLGPRQCIGQEMAIVVLKLALVAVVRDFDIEMAWDDWDKAQQRMGVKVSKSTVEGDRMYTTGKATAHPKNGGPAHARISRAKADGTV